jgi:hypothetical protein
VIVGENVKGLISRKTTESESVIDVIARAFREIGYNIAWRVYSCECLVPQLRERLVLVGIDSTKHTIDPLYLLPSQPDGEKKNLLSVCRYSSDGEIEVEEETVRDVTHFLHGQETSDHTTDAHPYLRLKIQSETSVYGGKTYQGSLVSFGKRVSPIHAEIADLSKPSKTIICSYDHQPRIYVPQRRNDGTPTLRCFTIGELLQIQGFPEGYRLSSSRQIHQIGNAVPPQLVEFVLRHAILRLSKPILDIDRNLLIEKIVDMFRTEIRTIDLVVNKGRTQEIENRYKEIFSGVLRGLGLYFEEASSQQPIDFRVFHPRHQEPILIEMKHTSGNVIRCNDTYPHPEIQYIILYPKGVLWTTGRELVTPTDRERIDTYAEHIRSLRSEFRKNGNVKMCARANYSIDIRHLI